MAKTTYIYALIDPRDQTPHYIGKTVQNPPQKRLRQHQRKPATDGLAAWIDDLLRADMKPTLETLETAPPGADWRAAEIYWIRHGLAQGWPLENRAIGGDNYPIEALENAEANDLIPRIIYAREETLKLLTSINAFVMRGRRAEDDTFRELFHAALKILEAQPTDRVNDMRRDLIETGLSWGVVQIGRGWRVPVKIKRNLIGGEFLTVGKPFNINGIGVPGKWDQGGWRALIRMYKKSSEILDTLATRQIDDRRRGYESVLQDTLEILASIFDDIAAM